MPEYQNHLEQCPYWPGRTPTSRISLTGLRALADNLLQLITKECQAA